jgi:hypothetical protein
MHVEAIGRKIDIFIERSVGFGVIVGIVQVWEGTQGRRLCYQHWRLCQFAHTRGGLSQWTLPQYLRLHSFCAFNGCQCQLAHRSQCTNMQGVTCFERLRPLARSESWYHFAQKVERRGGHCDARRSTGSSVHYQPASRVTATRRTSHATACDTSFSCRPLPRSTAQVR